MTTNKGFIKDYQGNLLLPISRGELILDSAGKKAFESDEFLATSTHAGLMSSAEKAMLNGTSGQGLSDLYTKLGYINTGLKFNGTALNFYNTNTATPINITAAQNQLLMTVNGNVVTLGLSNLQAISLSSSILRAIEVDKYGRVTSVSGSVLTNADIPDLSEKTLTNCITSDEDITSTDGKTIVNKKYVDTQITNIAAVAAGNLKFGGSVNTWEVASTYLNNASLLNHQYKVTTSFVIPKEHLYDTTGVTGDNLTVKVGDTLIIHKSSTDTTAKYVYIPSGDDITTITIKSVDNNNITNNIFTSKIGNFVFKFSNIFDVVNQNEVAYISIPQASTTSKGYLSKEDYIKFNNYATNLATTYSGELTSSTTGVYKIGTLTIGGTDNIIYGKDTVSTLTLENGADQTNVNKNPIFKFVKTGVADTNITFKGINGIQIIKNESSVNFSADNVVDTESTDFLDINSGYEFSIIKGSVNQDGSINEGITPYSEFISRIVTLTTKTVNFETITNSLSGETTGDEYRYGNTKLVTAITVTI